MDPRGARTCPVQEAFSGSMPLACLGLSPGAATFLLLEAKSYRQGMMGRSFQEAWASALCSCLGDEHHVVSSFWPLYLISGLTKRRQWQMLGVPGPSQHT